MNPYTYPNPAADPGFPFGTADPSQSAGSAGYSASYNPNAGYGASAAGYTPNPGYDPNVGYNPNAGYNPYAQPPTAPIAPAYRTSPALAFLLGWIPGVGAIYNGQYLKGLAHAVIFGVLVSLVSNAHGDHASAPFLGIMIAAFVFYMPFEAYHTAKKQRLGVPMDEWSSLFSRRSSSGRLPLGPMILILLGLLFLLDSLGLMSFDQVGRFWPVLLIVIGAAKLYGRVSHPPVSHPPYVRPMPPPPPPQPPADVQDVMGFRREQ